MENIEEYAIGNLTVTLHQDTDPSEPRQDCDHLGTMACDHPRYNLGDDHDLAGMDDLYATLIDHLTADACRELALYFLNDADMKQEYIELYKPGSHYDFVQDMVRQGLPSDDYRERVAEAIADSGSIVLPLYLYDHSGITISCRSFPCPWDSGQVGAIYVTAEKVNAEYGDTSKSSVTRAIGCLESEVTEYDQYLTGQVYGYVITDDDGTEVDSCWGFYGLDYCKEEATAQAKAIASDASMYQTANI
jgi:hypothetical protein